MNKIKEISFKITTSKKLICQKCRNEINGKEGYLKVNLTKGFGGTGSFTETLLLRLCWNCFKELIEETKEKRKTRKEDYDKLMKQRILSNL